MAPQMEPGKRAPGPLVQGFRGGDFVVEGQAYRGLWLTPVAAGEWSAPALSDLTIDHLASPLAIDPVPEFLLVGTGGSLRFPPRALIAALEECGIGVEAMDSRAAARTWGVLRAEERWFSAVLFPLDA